MALSAGEIEATLKLRDELTAQLKRAQAQLTATSKSFQNFGTDVRDAGSTLTKAFTLPIVGIGAAVIKFAGDFESSFAGVRKTVDASEPELQALAQGFRDMAKEIPINVNELNNIGAAAGQLGIETKNIIGFSETMAKLGVTTNLSSEEAATSLARLANITQMPQENFDRLGATIVGLGNNFATTEAEIVEFGLRIAGAGEIAGLTEAEILGIGTAMSSVGVEAEAGGTAVQKVLNSMSEAVATGSIELGTFAEAAGMSAGQFRQSFQQDAAGAFTAFVSGLKNQGDAAFKTLDNLGLGNERVIRAFLSLANAGDLLKNSISLASTEWEKNTALTEEARKRFETTWSQLTLLWNRIKDVGITLGNALLPAIKSAIAGLDRFIPILDSGAKLFASMPGPVQAVAIAILALVAAAGPALMALGVATIGVSSAMTGLSAASGFLAATTKLWVPFGGAVAKAGAAATAASAPFSLMSMALTAVRAALAVLTGPLGWFLAASATLLTVTGTWDELGRIIRAVGSIIGNLFVGALSRVVEVGGGFIDFLGRLVGMTPGVQRLGEFFSTLGSLFSRAMGAMADQLEYFADVLGGIEMPATKAASSLLPLPLAAKSTEAAFKLMNAQFAASSTPAELLAERMSNVESKLASARKEIENLSEETRNRLAKAVKSGAFELEELAKATGISINAMRMYQEMVDETTKKEKEAIKVTKERAEAIKDANLENAAFIRDTAARLYNEAVEKDQRRFNQVAANIRAELDARQKASNLIHRQTMSDLDFQIHMAMQERDARLRALDQTVEGYAAAYDAIAAETEILMQDIRNAAELGPLNAHTFIGPTLDMLGDQAQTFGEFIKSDLGKNIVAAFQGGGDVGGSIGSAVANHLFGKDGAVGSLLQKGASGLGKMIGGTIGSTIGGALGSVIPGLGTMLGGMLGGLVGKIFGGPSKEELEGRARIGEFEKMLNQTLSASQRAAAGNEQWRLTNIAVRDAFAAVGKSSTEAEMAVKRLWDSSKKGAEEQKAAMEAITMAFDKQKQASELLTSTVQKYKFTIDELGPAFGRQQLHERAVELFQDWQVLTEAGIDVAAVGREMQGSINAFLNDALRTGAEVDVAMRPMLQRMAEMGLLTDDAGNVITDLEEAGVTFSMTMSEGFKEVVDSVRELTDIIRRGLGLALDDVTNSARNAGRAINDMPAPDLPRFHDETGRMDVPEFATGSGGIQNFGAGTLAMLHGREGVFTEDQIANLVGGSAAPTVVVQSDNGELREEIAALRRDFTYVMPGLIANSTATALVKRGVRR